MLAVYGPCLGPNLMLLCPFRCNGVLYLLKSLRLLLHHIIRAIWIELAACVCPVHALAGGFSYRDHVERFGWKNPTCFSARQPRRLTNRAAVYASVVG